jgi:alpha-tubulin suppressor-like RCC1 family protein
MVNKMLTQNKPRMNKIRTIRSTIIIGMFFIHAIAAAGWAGELVFWGLDSYGAFGNTPTGTDFDAVSASSSHCIALTSDGSLVSWGRDDYGQVSHTPTGTGFQAVTAGNGFSVAVKYDGSLIAWGLDNYGQVSDTPAGTGFKAVTAGNSHCVAFRSDGSLVAWGNNNNFQVSHTPTGYDFVAVDAGTYFNVALKFDGSLAAWGSDYYLQTSNVPTGTGFKAVAAGANHGVAVKPDGGLVSWGDDKQGLLSNVPAGTNFEVVAAGYAHSVALTLDGSLVAWGMDSYGVVSEAPTGTGFTAVAAGPYYNVAIRGDVTLPPTTYTLTTSVSPSGSGYVTKYPNKSNYNDGESVQLTATAYSGYNFSHWSGSVSSYSNPVTITMNSNKTVTANFETIVTKPTVSITATDASAGEPSNDGSFRISRTGDTSTNLLVYYTTSGSTATSGYDYSALPGYVYIYAGQSSATIYIDVIDDSIVESSETVRLTISSNAAYNIGSPSYATVTIADDDPEPPTNGSTVTITAQDASAGEPSNYGYCIVSRSGDITSSLRVYYSTSGSTASAGADYAALPGYVDLSSGQYWAVVYVVVYDDNIAESSETVNLTISSNAAYTIGSPSSATVTIADDDTGAPQEAVVSISATDASAAEPANDGSFRISRMGDTSSSLLVYYSTSGSTASSGYDYSALSGYVYIYAGQSSATIAVNVIDDGTVESSETVRLTISSNAAYSIGSPSYATVTITDDDYQQPEQPVVTITAPDAYAGEPANDGYFRISRSGDTSATLLVYYSTSGSTASSGYDYAALSGYVYIPTGQSYAYVDVVVVDDGTVESTETVRLTISSNAAYTIGSPSYATVSITDDDNAPPPPVNDAEQMMADTLTFFYASVDDGSLVGVGTGKNNLVSFKKMLETAYDQIVGGNYAGACGNLNDALSRCDGLSNPTDYVEGSATSTLNAMIQEVINELGC